VLAGGRGRRLGGRNKALMPVGNGSAAERAVSLLQPLCATVFLSANRDQDRLRALPAQIIEDRRQELAGPLAGLERVAEEALGSHLLVLPCDMPLLRTEVLRTLQQALLIDPALDLVFAGAGERSHYLCAALRPRCLSAIPPLLDAGKHKVRDWLALLRFAEERFEYPLAQSLRNFNRLQDWASLETRGD
jgi:molybdopterin-guanine dinucleotide biosynthesis protein A